MVQTVIIRKEEKQIKVSFSFNTDLVETMREIKEDFGRGFYYKKEKSWIFPKEMLSPVRDILVKKMYNVEIRSKPESTYQRKLL